jgi:hypothetical protein
MSFAGERQLINAVQLLRAKGPGRGVLDDDCLGMRLNDHPSMEWILLLVVQGKSLGIFSLICGNF